jgi:hypothetical protein
MSIRDFFHGSGIITEMDQFVSLRLIKESLEKKFTVRILEETPHRIRCKVVRFARLYAAPMPFPNPSVEISFHNNKDETVINYVITDYDYYLLLILVLTAGISSAGLGLSKGLIGALRQGCLFSIFALLFFGSLVLIDARVFAHRIRMALLNRGK